MKNLKCLLLTGCVLFNLSCQTTVNHPSPSVEPTKTDPFFTPVVTSETKHPDLPEILVPGLELKFFFGSKTPGYKDGPLADALFNFPTDIAQDGQGNLYIADNLNHRIRMISPDGLVSTVAGSGEKGIRIGSLLETQFSHPALVEYIPPHYLYVMNIGYSDILKLDLKNKKSTIFFAERRYPEVDRLDSILQLEGRISYFSYWNGFFYLTVDDKILKADLNGKVEHYAGGYPEFTGIPMYVDGPPDKAIFDRPAAWNFDSEGNMYLGDNCHLRKVDAQTQETTSLAGIEPSTHSELIPGKFDCQVKDGPIETAKIGALSSPILINKDTIIFGDSQTSPENGNEVYSGLRILAKNKVAKIINNCSCTPFQTNDGIYLFEDVQLPKANTTEKTYTRALRVYKLNITKVDWSNL